MSGYAEPFDTYASMSHMLDREGGGVRRGSGLAHFCDALPTGLSTDPDAAR